MFWISRPMLTPNEASPELLGTGPASPRVLLLACSDACLDGGLLGRLHAERLIIVQTPGNHIRPWHSSESAETWPLEWSLSLLGLRDLVVCGHSQCAALRPKRSVRAARKQSFMSSVYRNLREGSVLLERVRRHTLRQLAHLRSYPAIADRVQQGELRLHAWVYLSESGTLLCYDEKQRRFRPLDV